MANYFIMNFGEEIAYWYLRFNGVFPLTNFVRHRGSGEYPSDCDLLAIRPPYVREEIGGTEDDWDAKLTDKLDFKRTLGVICEVKTGEIGEVFRKQNVDYYVDRLGFMADHTEVKECLQVRSTVQINEGYEIAKLLITPREPISELLYLSLSLKHVQSFIKQRITKYHKQKYSDRIYFNSTLLQQMIWETSLEGEST